jgi:hypothetical protein
VATATLVSDLSSGSKKPEPDNSVSTSEIYSWASQLASESRKLDWVFYWYVWPDAVREIIHKLETMNGGIIGLVGLQGIGKSSALLAIAGGRMLLKDQEYRRTHASGKCPDLGGDIVRFKWRRQSELLPSLLNNTHEASRSFRREYSRALMMQVKANYPLLIPEEVEKNPERLNPDWAAKRLGGSVVRALQYTSWLSMLRKKRFILIDTPDYSKTDRRLMAKDLDEIYWLWNFVSQPATLEDETKPTIIVAIQKEMFRDHFFFDKMEKIELEPMQPKDMVEAYQKRFKTNEPFTEDALLTLARMGRGIFRRFLRYITLTLQYSESHSKKIIDTETVKAAVTVERLAEDMELELVELFPKQSDLRLQAVRLLLLLEEFGPEKQTELVEELGIEDYAMSRLLAKLELHRYIVRRREGTDKIVSSSKTE